MEIEHLSLKEQNNADNPYEKALRCGLSCLSDRELLALVIRSGTRSASALELAETVIKLRQNGISGLTSLTSEELKEIKGIGEIKALIIRAVGELAVRMSCNVARERLCLDSPRSIAEYFMPVIAGKTEEECYLAYFDNRLHLTGTEIISKGNADSVSVGIDTVLRKVFIHRATGFVLIHNHPSGLLVPSRDDVLFTNRLREASSIVHLFFHDHIIVSDHDYYSFVEHNTFISQEEASS
jgi:DNA repair protein RadC